MLAKLREEEETLFVNESFLYLPVNGRSGFITALERGCDAIVLSQAQGGMKDMQFKVQTVRWTERSIMTVAPVKLTSPRTSTIDFGYDPDITDGIIAFQKPRLEG